MTQEQVEILFKAVAVLDDSLFAASLKDRVEVTTTTLGKPEWDDFEINVMIDGTDCQPGQPAMDMLRHIAVAAKPTGWEWEDGTPYCLPYVTAIGSRLSATLAAAVTAGRQTQRIAAIGALDAFCLEHDREAAPVLKRLAWPSHD